MIRLEGIEKTYPDFSIALDFSVARGEMVALLGPSGSGKTTALRIIAGFEKPDAGRILLNGKDVTDLDPALRRIGFVFQDYTLFPHLDLGHNISYGLKDRGLSRREIRERVADLLRLIGLPGHEKRRVETLSGGEQQRVAMARSLAVDPLVLMLDEPFSSIDSVLRRELREEVVRLQREVGITTLFITHDREEAFSVADRIILLRDGGIVQTGTPEDLYEKPVDRFTASFVGGANFLRGFLHFLEGGEASLRTPDGEFRVTAPGRERRISAFGGRRPAPEVPEGGPGVRALPQVGESRPDAGEGPPVWVMVRADRIRFAGGPGDNSLEARIQGRRYYGHYWEYLCDTASGVFSVYDRTRREPGTSALLHFSPADAVVVAD